MREFKYHRQENPIRYHFINYLKDEKEPWYRRKFNQWFHRRVFLYGSGWDANMEVCTGWSFRLMVTQGISGEYSTHVSLGLIFFTVYITFQLPRWSYFTEERIATWNDNEVYRALDEREYGLYFHSGSIWWFWHAKPMESSSKDPKWMRWSFNFKDGLLGRTKRVEWKAFDMGRPVFFRLGTKTFKIDEIKITKNESFRTRIPFSLWHHTYFTMDLQCKEPPMRSGKGENSWDCGDDGTYGLYCLYEGPEVSYMSYDAAVRWCVDKYVEGVLKDAARYGGSKGERGIRADANYKYLGFQKTVERSSGNRYWSEPVPGVYQFGTDVRVVPEVEGV